MSEETQKEIRSEHRGQQQKLVYYIIALCVTAIGFSIFRTNGQSLRCSHIVLLVAVLCWSLSIVLGLKFLKHSIDVLWNNNLWFDIKNRNFVDWTLLKDENIDDMGDGIMKYIDDQIGKYKNHVDWQEYLFYAGMVFFIIWHVLEMYLKPIISN